MYTSKKHLVIFALTMLLVINAVPNVMADYYYANYNSVEEHAVLPAVNVETVTPQSIIPLVSYVVDSGVIGTVPWRFYSDNTLVIEAGNFPSVVLSAHWAVHRTYIERIVFAGDVNAGTSLNGLFQNMHNLTEIQNLYRLNTAGVTSMSFMFNNARNLQSVDVSGFDTSSVTNMTLMFTNARSLTSLDLSAWDTSNVTTMSLMFADAESLIDLNLSSFDTSNVTTFHGMFADARSLTSLDVSGFDTSNATNMQQMFQSVESVEYLDVSGFDTHNVTTMIGMFSGASNLLGLDVSGFDTSNVSSFLAMFSGTRNLTYLDVSGFDTSNATNLANMFHNVSGVTHLDVSGFDTSNVTTMSGMFNGANSLTSLDVTGFDTSNVLYMDFMFQGLNLESLDLSSFDTITSIQRMFHMFASMPNLRQLTLGEQFRFSGIPNIPVVPDNTMYTGLWQNIGTGTITDPQGGFEFTSDQLTAQFDGSTMADTWVWQPRQMAYIPDTHHLNVTASTGGTVIGTVSGYFEEGDSIAVVATPNNGYHFVNWAATGVVLPNASTTTVTFLMPANAVTLTANFAQNLPGYVPSPLSYTLYESSESDNESRLQTTNARRPQIITQPESGITYTNESIIIFVVAESHDGGIISYQWYSNTINSNNGAIRIAGATNAYFEPPTNEVGTTYYFVVATNTNENVNGRQTATERSIVVSVTVSDYMVAESIELNEAPLQQPLLRLVIGNYEYTHNGINHRSDVAPFIDPNYHRTMVPLRIIAEALGAQVAWIEDDAQIVNIFISTAQLTLTIGESLPNSMGVPVIVNDRTFVPLRYVSEILGVTVFFDEENRVVYVY